MRSCHQILLNITHWAFNFEAPPAICGAFQCKVQSIKKQTIKKSFTFFSKTEADSDHLCCVISCNLIKQKTVCFALHGHDMKFEFHYGRCLI